MLLSEVLEMESTRRDNHQKIIKEKTWKDVYMVRTFGTEDISKTGA